MDQGAIADRDALQPLAGGPGGEAIRALSAARPAAGSLSRYARALQRLLQAGGLDGLEQIVDRVDLECLHRELIMGGNENHGRRMFAQQFHDLEPGQLRHLHVEQHQLAGQLLGQS